jgi:RHS repeat-associated protein
VTYGFDANGNLISSSAGGGSLTYNAKDQSTAITWNSTTLSPLSYADVGQTERVQAGSINQYSSPLGLVIDKVGTNRTDYIRDNNGNLIGQRNPDGTRWYYLKDGLGSVVAVINEAGTTIGHRYGYDAWGKQTSQSGTVANPWGYASGYLDTTGLIKFGTRYYDPNLGRWTQQVLPEGRPGLGGGDDQRIGRHYWRPLQL